VHSQGSGGEGGNPSDARGENKGREEHADSRLQAPPKPQEQAREFSPGEASIFDLGRVFRELDTLCAGLGEERDWTRRRTEMNAWAGLVS